MTVLAKYQRLEAEGLWRPDPEAQRRDVIVSVGDATLTIAAPSGTALSHWSLPAITRLNPGQRPALYAPGEDVPESLELADDDVVAAIEAVLKSIRRGTGHPGRLRALTLLSLAAVIIAAAVIWFPPALARYTASLVPESARAEIGQRLRTEIRRVTGEPCAEPDGLRALQKLRARLFPEGGVTVDVLPSALAETVHLPGGAILVGRSLVEFPETPDVLAGYILAEDLRRRNHDPMVRVVADAGFLADIRLLTTGELSDDALRRHAESIVASQPAKVPQSQLVQTFATRGVSGSAYAYAIDISGESTKSLIEASPDPASLEPLLTDGDWIALQGICEG